MAESFRVTFREVGWQKGMSLKFIPFQELFFVFLFFDFFSRNYFSKFGYLLF